MDKCLAAAAAIWSRGVSKTDEQSSAASSAAAAVGRFDFRIGKARSEAVIRNQVLCFLPWDRTRGEVSVVFKNGTTPCWLLYDGDGETATRKTEIMFCSIA